MSLTNFFKKLMIGDQIENKKPLKKIKDLTIFDDVWVKEDNIIYKGWILDITRRCIVVCYAPDLRDFRFRVDKFLDKMEMTQDSKVLYANEQK